MFPSFLSFTERHPRYVALVGFSIFVMGVVLYGFQYMQDVTPVEKTGEIQKSFPEPKKTEFGTTTIPEGFIVDTPREEGAVFSPGDFIAEIPLEEGIAFSQSYSLEYPDQKQHSVVFTSSKTGKENYTFYRDFLKAQNWVFSNEYEGDGVFSLYGSKEGTSINVTISDNESAVSRTSVVNISVLRK